MHNPHDWKTNINEYVTVPGSTAQGGSGSFKNRKPIGEVGGWKCKKWKVNPPPV